MKFFFFSVRDVYLSANLFSLHFQYACIVNLREEQRALLICRFILGLLPIIDSVREA